MLLAGAIAGGLYGLLHSWSTDLIWIVKAITSYGILGLILAYWVFVWLKPRRTGRTVIGAVIGAAIFVVVFSILSEQGHSNQIFAIFDNAVVGAFVGALFGTAPRGAFIGASAGAVATALVVAISLWLIGDPHIFVSLLIDAVFPGFLLGAWIGASRELDRRSKAVEPHP
ncbi:MAG: hypothetical protein HY870_03585 [Chloroflexi bacterium]|nr:hypothetical protein [Chloroflexota bacterium]